MPQKISVAILGHPRINKHTLFFMLWSRNKTPGERDQLAVSVTCGHFGDLGEWKRGYDRRNRPQDLNSVSCEDQGQELWLSPEQEINAPLKGWEKYMFGSQKQTNKNKKVHYEK